MYCPYHIGAREVEHIVVALEGNRPPRKGARSIVALTQLLALDECTHGSVEYQDALAQRLFYVFIVVVHTCWLQNYSNPKLQAKLFYI